jgi:hypothetical protein
LRVLHQEERSTKKMAVMIMSKKPFYHSEWGQIFSMGTC